MSDTLQEQLATLRNWSRVSFKKQALRSLALVLLEQEVIRDLLDGYFQGIEIRGTGGGPRGVLFWTNLRLFFLLEGSTSGDHEAYEHDELTSVRLSQRGHTPRISVEHGDGMSYFTPVGPGEQSAAFVNRIHHDMPSLNNPEPEGKQDQEPEGDHLRLGLIEARRVVSTVDDYNNFNADPDFQYRLINDLLYVAHVALGKRAEPSEAARLFAALTFLPLRQNLTQEKDLIEALFRFELLPLRIRRRLLALWAPIQNQIRKAGTYRRSSELLSLQYLSIYDQEKGTRHFDRVAGIFYSFCQVLLKGDGASGGDPARRLQELRTVIYRESEEGARQKMSNAEARKAISAAVHEEDDITIEEVIAQIDGLIGMDKVKEQIKTYINLDKVDRERRQRGLPVTEMSKHAVFYGPPGTGKTTMARLLGKAYRAMGVLARGHVIETDQAGLVAGFVGQTAIKVDELVQQALDGVLFIDEAYGLIGGGQTQSKGFGQEAVQVLLKRMEDYRERLVVIVAGYPDEMKQFIESNPGLPSRFRRHFYFDHYQPTQLMRILDIFVDNASLRLTRNARKALLDILTVKWDGRDRTFGNGRLVRNIFEGMIERQANRIASIEPLTDYDLCSLTKRDVPSAEDIEQL